MVSAIIAAVATILEPMKRYQEHLGAAKAFTTLKHDARFLHNAESLQLTDDAFVVRVTNLHDQYNTVVRSVPPTEKRFFEKARAIVQSGIHEPDS